MKEKIRIRSGCLYKGQVSICKHLKVKGEITTDRFPNCEYVEQVEVYCEKCKKWINFEIAIN